VNKDLKICTLTDNVPFRCEITVKRGRGYVTAEENIQEDQELGTIRSTRSSARSTASSTRSATRASASTRTTTA
jgi:hypothetical protein